jgi:hypothetical protein
MASVLAIGAAFPAWSSTLLMVYEALFLEPVQIVDFCGQ